MCIESNVEQIKSCMVEFTVEMTERHAMALAQMIKRLSHDDFERLSKCPEEAQEMLLACFDVADALKANGFNPR